MIYYVYTYTDPRNLEVFYVGFGKNRRMTDHIRLAKNGLHGNYHFANRINAILRDGLKPITIKVQEALEKNEAKNLEIKLIAKYGRRDLKTGTLTNRTAGGDGAREWSEDQRLAQSARRKNRIGVADSSGNRFTVSNDDPRWLSGELKGQNAGIKSATGNLKGLIQAKDETGNFYRVPKTDPRWLSGELVGVNVGVAMSSAARNKISMALKGKETTGRPTKKCTIDGQTFFNSWTDLQNTLGRGKNGARSPNFRYA